MLEKLIKILSKNGVYILRDIAVLALILSFLIGTILYLYNYHKEKESYALNIVLTAFVSRITGVEFIEALRVRFYKVTYYIKSIINQKQFVNANRQSRMRNALIPSTSSGSLFMTEGNEDVKPDVQLTHKLSPKPRKDDQSISLTNRLRGAFG